MNRHRFHTAYTTLPGMRFAATQTFADAGEGGASAGGADGAGGSGGDAGHAAPPAQPNWDGLFADLKDTLGNKLDGLTRTVVEAKPEPPKEPDPDVEAMTNVELSNFIFTKIETVINDALRNALTPHAEQINSLRTDITLSTAERQIEGLRSQHKDFNDWSNEMVALAKEHPTLSVARLYTLARGENPEKAKTLDAKHNPAPERPRLPFSMTGTGEGGRSNGNSATPPATKEEAGRQAYEEVAARHPVLAALQRMN